MSNNWKRIKQALENPGYTWRTIDGIRHDTGIDDTTIIETLATHAAKILKSATPSATGKELYTTCEHYRRKYSLWEQELRQQQATA